MLYFERYFESPKSHIGGEEFEELNLYFCVHLKFLKNIKNILRNDHVKLQSHLIYF